MGMVLKRLLRHVEFIFEFIKFKIEKCMETNKNGIFQ